MAATKIATALDRLNLDDPTPEKILSHLQISSLSRLWTADNPEGDLPTTKKRQFYTDNVLDTIEEAGVKVAVESFKLPLAQAVLAPANIDHHDNTPRLRVLKKRLFEQLKETGVEQYFQTHFSDNAAVLREVCIALEIAFKEKDTAESLIKSITYEVSALGLEAYFSSFSVDVLSAVCNGEGIKTSTRRRDALVQAILTRELPELPAKAKKAVSKKVPAKPSKIAKGVTYQQLYQHFNVEELKDYCRDNNLIQIGKKKVVIDRILGFLDGDKENIRKAPLPRRAARRSKAATTAVAKSGRRTSTAKKTQESKPADKPKTVKKVNNKKTEDKPKEEAKPEPKETVKPKSNKKTEEKPKVEPKPAEPEPMEEDAEEEEAAEEEAEEEVAEEEEAVEDGEEAEGEEAEDDEGGLDLENLEQYDISVLKEYIEAEELKPKGNTKKHYIDAILEYNPAD